MNSWSLLGNTSAEYKKFIGVTDLMTVSGFLIETNALKQGVLMKLAKLSCL